jgi:Ca2+-binding RTX toxin-like protein
VIIGNAGANILIGLDGDDTLIGGGGADRLIGGEGDDVLVGSGGIDLLTGGTGSDQFVLNFISEARDTILDFTAGLGGDVLDISDLLQGFDEVLSDPHDYVQLLSDGTDTRLRVDPNGQTGGSAFRDAFLMSDVTGVNIDDLIADGNLALV